MHTSTHPFTKSGGSQETSLPISIIPKASQHEINQNVEVYEDNLDEDMQEPLREAKWQFSLGEVDNMRKKLRTTLP